LVLRRSELAALTVANSDFVAEGREALRGVQQDRPGAVELKEAA
jgi:hypothetical protein